MTINADSAAASFEQVRRRDWLGHAAHVIAAVCYLGLLGTTTVPASIAYGFLVGIALLRLPHTWRLYGPLFRHDIVGWLIGVWAALHLVSLAWSPDWREGWDELKVFRIVVTSLALWPILDYAAWMIGAFLIGVATQHIAQIGQAMNWIERGPYDGVRLRGWIHPIHTATLCVMAMCLHLSAIITGRGWLRWASIIGFIAAGAGLVATGSRGPWLVAAATLPICALIVCLRRPNARKPIAWLAVGTILCAAAMWPFVNDLVMARVSQASEDLQAVRDGNYSKDIGYRFASWDAAWNLFLQKPLLGHGIGAYAITSTDASQHGDVLKAGHHAHSIYLQTLATTGIVGAGLLMAILIGAVGRAWKARVVHPYALGTAGALLAWSLAGLFDDPHQSGQMFGIFVALAALAASNGLPARPLPGQSASNRYADDHESDDGIAAHQHDA